MELPDIDAVTPVAKQMARYLASREIAVGRLDMGQDMLVTDESGAVLATFPMTRFVHVS
nr:hypothetical protein [Aurantiacibacter spongiae]